MIRWPQWGSKWLLGVVPGDHPVSSRGHPPTSGDAPRPMREDGDSRCTSSLRVRGRCVDRARERLLARDTRNKRSRKDPQCEAGTHDDSCAVCDTRGTHLPPRARARRIRPPRGIRRSTPHGIRHRVRPAVTGGGHPSGLWSSRHREPQTSRGAGQRARPRDTQRSPCRHMVRGVRRRLSVVRCRLETRPLPGVAPPGWNPGGPGAQLRGDHRKKSEASSPLLARCRTVQPRATQARERFPYGSCHPRNSPKPKTFTFLGPYWLVTITRYSMVKPSSAYA